MDDNKNQRQARFLYLTLAGIFISLLVSCNLIFLKFIAWEPFGMVTFIISVGLIPYPLTFLVTDLISEIFGEKRANDVVKVGLICAILVTGLTLIADATTAIPASTVSDAEFHKVFGLTPISVGASMIAYLIAQLIDIRIFHFWKRLTKGKHLWLRNNFSTMASAVIDTLTVLLLLCAFGALPWSIFGLALAGGIGYKLVIAVLDTPVLYAAVYLIRRKFKLDINQDLKI